MYNQNFLVGFNLKKKRKEKPITVSNSSHRMAFVPWPSVYGRRHLDGLVGVSSPWFIFYDQALAPSWYNFTSYQMVRGLNGPRLFLSARVTTLKCEKR